MPESRTYQVHANVNADNGDAGLRVTLTYYDENGHEIATRTWRRHVKDISVAGIEWQAYYAVSELVKMMAFHAGTEAILEEPDVPLF